jgi:hypothetical protein
MSENMNLTINFRIKVNIWNSEILPFIPAKHRTSNRFIANWDWWSMVGFFKPVSETFIL